MQAQQGHGSLHSSPRPELEGALLFVLFWKSVCSSRRVGATTSPQRRAQLGSRALMAEEIPVPEGRGVCQHQQMVCVCFSKRCHLRFLMCLWTRTKAFLTAGVDLRQPVIYFYSLAAFTLLPDLVSVAWNFSFCSAAAIQLQLFPRLQKAFGHSVLNSQ